MPHFQGRPRYTKVINIQGDATLYWTLKSKSESKATIHTQRIVSDLVAKDTLPQTDLIVIRHSTP